MLPDNESRITRRKVQTTFKVADMEYLPVLLESWALILEIRFNKDRILLLIKVSLSCLGLYCSSACIHLGIASGFSMWLSKFVSNLFFLHTTHHFEQNDCNRNPCNS